MEKLTELSEVLDVQAQSLENVYSAIEDVRLIIENDLVDYERQMEEAEVRHETLSRYLDKLNEELKDCRAARDDISYGGIHG